MKERPDLRGGLGFLFSVPSLTVKVRARKFVGVENDTIDTIAELLQEYYMGGQI